MTKAPAVPSAPLSPSDRVRAAVANTRRVLPGYFEKTCQQRASRSPEHRGSTIPGTPDEVAQIVLDSTWEPYEHPAIAAGCVAFRTPGVPGMRLGVVPLDALDHGTLLTLLDVKGTGYVEAEVEAAHVPSGYAEGADFLVAILGDEDGTEVVYTFHPGAPVPPSRVKSGTFARGAIRVGSAVGTGHFQHVKVR